MAKHASVDVPRVSAAVWYNRREGAALNRSMCLAAHQALQHMHDGAEHMRRAWELADSLLQRRKRDGIASLADRERVERLQAVADRSQLLLVRARAACRGLVRTCAG